MYIPSTNENKRIHGQGGLHLYTPENISVEGWIRDNLAKLKGTALGTVPLLVKILIPNSERKTILSSLNKMNFNHLSLFPDFEGAAKYCNMALFEGGLFGLREY